MLAVERIDPDDRSQRRRFVDLPYRLYRGDACWVPPLRADIEFMLDRRRHPFYENSEAELFVAAREGRIVGRMAVLENRTFNRYHGTRKAQFCLFECEDDQEAATVLFEAAFAWARSRGLDTIYGPRGFGAMDGYGFLVDGFEHRQAMTLTNYNPPYYPRLVEALGFTKEIDFISFYLTSPKVPARVASIAERVRRRGGFRVVRFTSKKDLREWALRIGEASNGAYTENWGYYPLTPREIEFILESLLRIADPRLIKVVTAGDEVAGFVLGFRDVSAAMQRAGGRLFPFGVIGILWEMRHSKWLAVGHAAILPRYQGRGGNALLYNEMCKSIEECGIRHADITQAAETNTRMLHDLATFGAKPYKTHRVYTRTI
jgi:hypothetical protein